VTATEGEVARLDLVIGRHVVGLGLAVVRCQVEDALFTGPDFGCIHFKERV
jgi:hypothetical protein